MRLDRKGGMTIAGIMFIYDMGIAQHPRLAPIVTIPSNDQSVRQR